MLFLRNVVIFSAWQAHSSPAADRHITDRPLYFPSKQHDKIITWQHRHFSSEISGGKVGPHQQTPLLTFNHALIFRRHHLKITFLRWSISQLN